MKYHLAIHKDKNVESCYAVTVTNIDGCFSSGETLEEAVSNSRDAIILHLGTAREMGYPVTPRQVELDTLKADPGYMDAEWIEINVEDPFEVAIEMTSSKTEEHHHFANIFKEAFKKSGLTDEQLTQRVEQFFTAKFPGFSVNLMTLGLTDSLKQEQIDWLQLKWGLASLGYTKAEILFT